jgi:hypothetical protein
MKRITSGMVSITSCAHSSGVSAVAGCDCISLLHLSIGQRWHEPAAVGQGWPYYELFV